MKPGLCQMADCIVRGMTAQHLRQSIEESRLWASEPELLKLIYEGLVGNGATEEEATAFLRSVHALAGTVLH